MKRKLLTSAFLLVFSAVSSWAQLVYTVTQTAGTMTNLTSPTTILNGGNDDYGTCETAIGFTFLFGGTPYTTFNTNCDGFMNLGTGTVVGNLVTVNSMLRQGTAPAPPTVPSACNPVPAAGAANAALICNCNNGSAGLPSMYINNMTTTQYLPMISPLWDDWVTNSATGKINYERSGTAPNRRLTIEWLNLARWPNYNTAAYSMQVTLYETTNRIDMLYRFEGVTQSVGASIGVRTACAGDQYFLNVASTIDNITNPSRTTENRLNLFPGSGVLYRWTPPPAAVVPTNDKLCNTGSATVAGGACFATPLAYNVSCNPFSTTIFGTSQSKTGLAASSDAEYTIGGCGNTNENDIWFYVDLPVGSTTMVVSTDNSPPATCGNTGGVQFEIYQSTLLAGSPNTCPGALGAQLVCSDNGGVLNANNSTTATLSGLTANRRYYIRVEGDAALTPDFQICVKDKFNDEPCTAAALTPSGSCVPFAATTVGATPSKCFAGGTGSISTTAGQNQTTYVPAGGDCQVYQSAAGATNVANTITVTTTTGLVVGQIVRVGAGTGSFPNGTTVTSILTATTFTTSAAPTVALGGGAVIVAGTSNINDVWFKFVAAAGKDYVIDTYAGSLNDGAMALYTGVASPACPLPAAIMTTGLTSFPNFSASLPAIGDKVPTGYPGADAMPRIVTSGLTAGATYWIRFWKGSTAPTDGTFSICIYERPTCGASGIGCPAPTGVNFNPNGNYNGTLCSTSDPDGLCAEKIPTIGTAFAPLCGDNANAKGYYGVMPATSGSTTTLTTSSTAGLVVGSLMHTVVPGGPITFPAGTTITSIVNATTFTVSNAPSGAFAAQQLTINSAPLGETPPNNLFCTSAALPNAHMILRPIFYRVQPTAGGSLQMDFDNILTTRNQGIRAALYTISPTPSIPAHSCAGVTWTLVPADFIGNTFGSFVGVNRYCNTNAGAIAAGLSGNPNTAKFTMRWNSVSVGTVYYLMVDGSGPQSQADRAFFSVTFSGTAAASPTDGVLAIKLLNFSGKNLDGSNVLNWYTASEQDNDYFVLQRSKDGESFENIATVKGVGNSTSLSSYESIDNSPYTGINYYRLKSVDKQGIGSYSEIITVYSPTGKKIEFEGVHPNPSSGNIFSDFYVTENTTLTVEIRHISGQLVKTYNATVIAGKNSLESDTRELSGGLYFISIMDRKSGEKYTARFVKE
jgi:Secretion system C-terminal sorting domain